MALTPEQIAAARAKLGIKVEDPTIANRNAELDTAWGTKPSPKLGEGAAGEFGGNFVRAVTAPLVRTGAAIESGLDQTAGRVINAAQGKGFTPTTSGKEAFQAADAIQQGAETTPAAQAGTFAGETLPYFLPAGGIAKAEKGIQAATQVLPAALGVGARILGKAAVNAAPTAAIKLAQSGSPEEAAKAALTAGTVRAGMSVIGEGANLLHIPEKLYTTIFKNTTKDMLAELDSRGIAAMEKNNPELYDDLVKQGIFNVGTNGKATVNKTLAVKALDSGLKGSVNDMANTVVKNKYESESAARAIAAAHKEPIDLSRPQYEKVLRELADEYKDVGFGEVEQTATNLADTIKNTGGMVDAKTALEVRRFLDKMRFASSFDKPVSKLSISQANLKTLSDAARKEINAIPGMRDVMSRYSFSIDALEALANEAKRMGNNQVLGLIDSLFLGGGVAGGNPVAGGVGALARRTLGNPVLKTNAAQSIKGGVLNPNAAGAINAASGGLSEESQ